MSLDAMRPGTMRDAIDGVIPRHVAQPESPEAMARALARASREGHSTVLRGGGTKLEWGRVPAGLELIIETTRLDRLVAHRHGDMTVTAQAGLGLAALNRTLGERGQYLPVDTAFEGTTVGGMVATNDSGPLRHRYGTPRDLLIGVTLATCDGRLIKAGGTVVKNVAGYDLGKLVSGSHGGLLALVDATFKLLPIPHASATLVATYPDPAAEALCHDVGALQGSQVEAASFDLRVSEDTGAQLLLRLASSPAATEAQADEARRLLSCPAISVGGDAERVLWADQVRMPWREGGTIIRLSWLPARLPGVLTLFQRLRRDGCGRMTFTGRASGAGLLRLEGDERASALAIDSLRSSAEVGHVIVLRATRRLKDRVDVWGPAPGDARIAVSLKRMFDPSGILNAGRGPI